MELEVWRGRRWKTNTLAWEKYSESSRDSGLKKYKENLSNKDKCLLLLSIIWLAPSLPTAAMRQGSDWKQNVVPNDAATDTI
jgi:hypothetical protein